MDSESAPLTEPPAPLAQGTRLGKYAIVRKLGAGGMGTVYEATHAEIGKRVAIKVLSAAASAMPGARARFLREAQLTSKVHHPHAVDVTDTGSEGELAYLVMELLSGQDLAARLRHAGPLAAPELVDLTLAVCSAVMAAHRAGVIHRDLKPQNIFLADAAHGVHAKVLDFGISKYEDTPGSRALTSSGAVLGTPYYLAPEQVVDNRAASAASDQYAIGVILYECLTGVRPFEGDSLFNVFQAIVAGAPIAPRQYRRDLDPALEAVVLRAMEVDPTRRFASVEELGRALWPFAGERARMLWRETFGSGPTPAARPAPATKLAQTIDDASPRALPPPRAPAAIAPALQSRGSGRLVFAVVAVGAIAAGAGWWIRSGGETRRERETTAVVQAAPPPVVAPPARTYAASLAVEPATAKITLDGASAGVGRMERTFPADGSLHTLMITADGHDSHTVSFRDAPPPQRITLTARPGKEAPAAAAAPAAQKRVRRERVAKPKAAGPRGTPTATPAANPDDAPVIE